MKELYNPKNFNENLSLKISNMNMNIKIKYFKNNKKIPLSYWIDKKKLDNLYATFIYKKNC